MELSSRREEVEQKAADLLAPIVEEAGFELVDVEYVKELRLGPADSGRPGFGFMWISCILSRSMEHEKNFILLSSEDIDKDVWKMIVLTLTFTTLIFSIKVLFEFRQASSSDLKKV